MQPAPTSIGKSRRSLRGSWLSDRVMELLTRFVFILARFKRALQLWNLKPKKNAMLCRFCHRAKVYVVMHDGASKTQVKSQKFVRVNVTPEFVLSIQYLPRVCILYRTGYEIPEGK